MFRIAEVERFLSYNPYIKTNKTHKKMLDADAMNSLMLDFFPAQNEVFSAVVVPDIDSSLKESYSMMGISDLGNVLDEFVAIRQEKALLPVYHKGHWTALMLQKDNNKINAIYVDSLGHEIPTNIAKKLLLRKIKYAWNKTLMQVDRHSCGVHTVSNLVFLNSLDKNKVNDFVKGHQFREYEQNNLRSQDKDTMFGFFLKMYRKIMIALGVNINEKGTERSI